MDSKKTLKTVDTWAMSPEEIFKKAGIKPVRGNKTGCCIIPVRRNRRLK